MEAQRDEDLEAAGLVLQLAQPQHVVDAVPRLLDVAVEHRRRRAQALLVREPVDARPVLPVRLVVDDLLADVPVEDLGAAAGQRLQPGVDQLVEDLVGGQAGDLLEEVHLGGGERLQRDARGSAAFSSRSTRG